MSISRSLAPSKTTQETRRELEDLYQTLQGLQNNLDPDPDALIGTKAKVQECSARLKNQDDSWLKTCGKKIIKIYNDCVTEINLLNHVVKAGIAFEKLEISISKEIKSDSGGGHSRSVTVSAWGSPVSDDADAAEGNLESGDAEDENEVSSPIPKSGKESNAVHGRNESGYINALHAHKLSESNPPILQSNPSETSVLPKDLLHRREPTRTADLKPIEIPKSCCILL